MKKIAKILIYCAIILGVLWALLNQFHGIIRPRLSPALNDAITNLGIPNTPCSSPLPYTLGAFDAKFGISKKYFLSTLLDAEAIWEKPFGKELFAYSEDDKDTHTLKINLVYDFRQQATGKLAEIGIVVKDNRASYDSLKAKFTEMKANFAAAKGAYDLNLQSFIDRQKAYEQEVGYWNAQGGAPEAEYNKLQAEKSALVTLSSGLQAELAKVNAMVDDINAAVVVLNRLAATLNLSVDDYNTIGASRGESFEEGVYQSDGVNAEIDIYEFSSRDKLVRVLAHELGHALSLAHVDDPKAIMYKLNQGNNKTLTPADLAELKTKCEVK